jgi:hypothetical protein
MGYVIGQAYLVGIVIDPFLLFWNIKNFFELFSFGFPATFSD